MGSVNHFGQYLLQAAAIIATPGADVLLALATALASGRRAGLAAVAGMSCGYLIHSAIAALGLAVLLSQSPSAVTIVEFLGATYLLWAGATQLRNRHDPPPSIERLREPFRRGFLTSLLNAKGVLFFLAFLPGFLPQNGRRNVAAFGLGLTFAGLAVLIYGGYVLAAGALRDRLTHPRTYVIMRTVAGVVFLFLGALALRRAAAGL